MPILYVMLTFMSFLAMRYIHNADKLLITTKDIVTNKWFDQVKSPTRVLRNETTYDNKRDCFYVQQKF